jgi:glyoxylase I family protein
MTLQVIHGVRATPGVISAQLGSLAGIETASHQDMEAGPGGRQIQIEDQDGNPIEMFEPAR